MPGATGAERYEVLELLGEGVSARVYRARDRQGGAEVALKVLSPHLRTDPISIERFRREVQITRHLNHPQIVRILDFQTAGEAPLLAMELLRGHTLKELAALEHPLDVERVLSMLRQLLEVLQACHARGVLHRDLKSRNVMIDAKDRITLLDFGIARMTALRDLTQTGTSLGSPEYMAPELFATATHDACTDLYAVGVIGFELLTGRLPFQGDTLALLYRQHCEAAPPSIRELRPEVPEWLESFVHKLLEKQRHRRHQSAGEALSDVAARRVVARALPALPRRPCLACGEPTPVEVQICTSCGAQQLSALDPGPVDLHCAVDADDGELRRFGERYLGLQASRGRRRTTLMLRDIAQASGERIRSAGARHGIYFDLRPALRGVRHQVWLGLLAKLLGFCLLAPLALETGALLVWQTLFRIGGAHALALAATTQVFVGLAILCCVVYGPVLAVRSALARRPWLAAAEPRQSAAQRSATAEHAWLATRAERVAALGSAALRAALARTFESYLVLIQHGRSFDAPLRERLQGLLDAGLELAALASELEARLGDEAQRADWLRRYGADSEQMRALCALEDAHASMLGALTSTQAGFNRALGHALVLDAPIDETELAIARELLARLGDEWAVSTALERTLDELA